MEQTPGPTLEQIARDLAAGRTTSRNLVEECLARIDDPRGQGAIAFMQVDREAALAAADAMDMLRTVRAEPSRFAGIPISIKDLFDVRGQVTRAGSKLLAGPPAERDATAVARLRAAGFVPIGRTNMTEFAYSGLGLNPHYGTPLSPWKRDEGHISGGSTSGGAVSVADGMAHVALGTDTGGSCRIPAAWCGLVGFKPTARRTPRAGVIPLSTTLDCVGSLARSVACCAAIDAILAGEGDDALPPIEMGRLRIGALQNVVLGGIEPGVLAAYEAALAALEAAGALVERITVEAFDRIAPLSAKGGFPAAEAYAWHRRMLSEQREAYDPRVSIRIMRGTEQDAADYVELLAGRASLIEAAEIQLAGFDTIAMPTTPILPPLLSLLEQDDEIYGRSNILALRNATLINMIDGCAISLPAPSPDGSPMGLMLASTAGRDRQLLAIAQAVEQVLQG
jgi:aspartyl-tRNA(Asn)/glutamyl-tRNA(Gln) amidotransferase subunit A